MTFNPNISTIMADGPSADPEQPSKPLLRQWGTNVEAICEAFTTNGGLIFATKALMVAQAATYSEPRSAWVYADSTPANNGVYVLNPTTDTWSKVGRLPYDFVIGTDLGAGTANAIQITTDIPVADGMIVVFTLFEATTSSPVTVAINGGAALTLKTNRGNNASALTAGMEIWGRYRASDNTFRLLNDQDVSALVAQAEAARDEAVAVAATFPAIAANTMLVDNAAGTARETKTFAQVRSLLGLTKSIMDYTGAYGNDVDYDDAAFTAAAADAGMTYLPPRPYKFSPGFKCVVPIGNFGKTFFSEVGRGTEFSYNSAVIKTNTSGADVSGGTGAAAFEFLGSQQKLINIAFLNQGTVKGTDFRAVRFDHEATGVNTDDIDSEIIGCQFTDYGVGVRQNGRGIKMTDCAGVNIGDLLVWSFPATGAVGDPIQSDPILGSRAATIVGNRLHNASSLVVTTGAYAMRGFDISGNDCDLGDTIVSGGFEDGLISNNVCRFSEGLEGPIYITGFGSRLVIVGNHLGGGTLAGVQAGTVGVAFSLSGDVNDTIVANNVMTNLAWHGISFSGGARPYRCVMANNSMTKLGRDAISLASGSFLTRVCENTLSVYGQDADVTRAALRLTGTHERMLFANNAIDPVTATAKNVRMQGTITLTKSQFVYNNATLATLINGAYTDGGGNDVATGNITG